MRKSKAIRMLNRQISKLEDNNFLPDEKFVIHTQDYIMYFFGVNSPQFDYISRYNYHFYPKRGDTDEKIKENLELTKNDVKQFIRDCIEIIEYKGTVNQNHNFLERVNNIALIPIIITISFGLLTVGYIFGVSTTDSKNIELRQENKQLKDSLSFVKPTFKIPNNIYESN